MWHGNDSTSARLPLCFRGRGQRGWILGVALIVALVGLISAMALSEVGFQAQRQIGRQVAKSNALAAACAGVERSKLVLANSSIFTSHTPISYSGTLTNETYSVNIAWVSGLNVSVVSTGSSNGAQCTLTRVATGASPTVNLHGFNYVGTYSKRIGCTVQFMSGREPLRDGSRPETPDFNYYKQLAISQGHYYSGSASFSGSGVITNGTYFAEGSINISGTRTLSSGTLVAMRTISCSGSGALTSPSWVYPLMLANGNIDLSGSRVYQGAIYSQGSFRISGSSFVTGRVDASSITMTGSSTVTDASNQSVYQQLNGFTYAGGGGGGSVAYSEWDEQY